MTLTPSQPDPSPEPGVIRLTGHGTTVTAEDLRTQLVLASDFATETRIDATDLLSVGQAVLQLLVAARREAGVRDHGIQYSGASQAFSDRVHDCKLAEAIGLETEKDVSQ